eukprot:365734-Chlamydomonas_euryale.AAC.27
MLPSCPPRTFQHPTGFGWLGVTSRRQAPWDGSGMLVRRSCLRVGAEPLQLLVLREPLLCFLPPLVALVCVRSTRVPFWGRLPVTLTDSDSAIDESALLNCCFGNVVDRNPPSC